MQNTSGHSNLPDPFFGTNSGTTEVILMNILRTSSRVM
jgi:hypothetical protein